MLLSGASAKRQVEAPALARPDLVEEGPARLATTGGGTSPANICSKCALREIVLALEEEGARKLQPHPHQPRVVERARCGRRRWPRPAAPPARRRECRDAATPRGPRGHRGRACWPRPSRLKLRPQQGQCRPEAAGVYQCLRLGLGGRATCGGGDGGTGGSSSAPAPQAGRASRRQGQARGRGRAGSWGASRTGDRLRDRKRGWRGGATLVTGTQRRSVRLS